MAITPSFSTTTSSAPPTLLISALGRVPDVRHCVQMDWKEPGNLLFLIVTTKDEMGGSHYHLVRGIAGGAIPLPDLERAPDLFRKLHEAIRICTRCGLRSQYHTNSARSDTNDNAVSVRLSVSPRAMRRRA
jgi:phosphoribosylformylglycinamidine (FGAM) synthase-like enzyme